MMKLIFELGEWKGNFRHGFGVEKYKQHVYEGEWQSNRKYGRGVFRWPDSDYYIGEWKMGCKVGVGLLVSKGNVILQEWKEGEEGAGEEIEKALTKVKPSLDFEMLMSLGKCDLHRTRIASFPFWQINRV